jgi:hypothetical protein
VALVAFEHQTHGTDVNIVSTSVIPRVLMYLGAELGAVWLDPLSTSDIGGGDLFPRKDWLER